MKKLLLISPPFCTPVSPPYSITYLKTFLKNNLTKKYEINLLDLNLEFHKYKFPKFKELFQNYDYYKNNIKDFKKSCNECYSLNNKKVVRGENPELLKELLNKILEEKPKFVAFSIVYSSQVFYASSLIKKLEENNIEVIIGGPAVNKKIINLADHYFKNEVEFLEFLESKKTDFKKLNIKRNLQYENLNDYFSFNPCISIKTTSCCYFQQCTFCTHHQKQQYFEYSLKEIEETVKLSGAKEVFVIDDMIHKKRLLELSKIFKPLGVKWMCQLKPNLDYDEETLKLAYDSGLRIVIWGVESGSNRILDLMKKGTKIEEVKTVLKTAKKVGINNVCYIMFGFPTETKEEFLETINFLKENIENIDLVSTATFGLQKGSETFEKPEDFGIINITEQERTVLDPKITHELKTGLTNEEVRKLRSKFRKTLAKINKYPKEMNFYREHMLNLVKS